VVAESILRTLVAEDSQVSTGPAEAAPSFDELYGNYFDFVWRTVRRFGVPPAQLEDAVQDVFVVVHRRLPDYEPRHSPKSWLYAIAHRVASDHRRTQRRKGGGLPISDSIPAPSLDGPLEGAVRRESGDIVLGFLETLDDARREVFVLAELEQMSAPEISDLVKANTSTVYSRLRSARQELVKYVAQHHPDVMGGQDG